MRLPPVVSDLCREGADRHWVLTIAVVDLRRVGLQYCVGAVGNVVRTPHSRELRAEIYLVCHKEHRLLVDRTIEVVPRLFQMLNLDLTAGW